MTIPLIGYLAPVPGHPKQLLPRSDWPLFAAISALGSGQYLGNFGAKSKDILASWLHNQDIPEERLALWLLALSGQHLVIPKLMAAGPGAYRYIPEMYQFYAAQAMSCAGGVLALGCGLGKTLTAEVVVTAVAPRYFGKPLVIATTLTAFGAWKAYIPRFEALGFSKVHLVSIDSLHKFEPGFRSDGGVLIFDEGHLLGEVTSRRTKHALKLRLKVDYCLVLTGTLFHGGILRAVTCMNLAVPGLGAFASKFAAAAYFNCIEEVTYKETKGDKTVDVTRHKIVKPTGDHHARFQDFVTRRFVCSLAKTSPIVQQSVNIPEQDQKSVHFDGPWGSVHQDAVQEIRRAIEANEGIPHASAVRQKLARSGLESKTNYLLDQLSDAAPAVVFAQYHESLDHLEQAFMDAGIIYVRVDGSVTGSHRSDAIAKFQAGEAQVFLGQIEAAGISVELTRSSRSFALDLSWRPDVYDQALARTCRRGQEFRCTHTDLIANRLQEGVVATVRSGKVFDASMTEYQDVARAMTEATSSA